MSDSMSDEDNTSSALSSRQLGSYVLPIAAGTIAVLAVPPLLGVVGFKAGGIYAGSLAAKWMSATAIANGGGVASGSAVAIAQSIGAGGLSTVASTGIGTSVAAGTVGVQKIGGKVAELSGTVISATGSGIKSTGGYVVGMVDNETVRSGASATARDLKKIGGKVADLTMSGSAAVESGVVSVAGGVKKLVVGENSNNKE